MVRSMSHAETQMLLSVKQIISVYGFSKTTFERWRDAVYQGVGDPPYSQDELKIILEYAEKQSTKAFGVSRNKNNRKIARALKNL